MVAIVCPALLNCDTASRRSKTYLIPSFCRERFAGICKIAAAGGFSGSVEKITGEIVAKDYRQALSHH